MSLMNPFIRVDIVDCLRYLLLFEFAALFISTSLTSVAEVLLLASFSLVVAKLRNRILAALQQPIVVATFLFLSVIGAGMFYGEGTLLEKLSFLAGWRKLLLLPLAAILFDEPLWKRRLAWVLVCMATASALASFAGLLGYSPTIIVHNHATQGMFFAAGAFTAIVLFFCEKRPAGKSLLRCFLLLSAALLVVNTIFVTSGRSGYVALLVLSAFAAFMLSQGRIRIGFAIIVTLIIVVLLALSPIARKRITVGIFNMRNYEQAEEYTDMGIRMVMWKNTLRIIEERPVVGHGLGGFREAYRKQVGGVTGWQGIVVDDPHNQYLKITAEHGIIGLLVFLGFIGSFFYQHVPKEYRVLGLGVLLAWCATSLFSGHFNTSGEGRFLMLWCGAQLAAASVYNNQKRTE